MEQVANFSAVDEMIKAELGVECDPYVLESLEKEFLVLPDKTAPVYNREKMRMMPMK